MRLIKLKKRTILIKTSGIVNKVKNRRFDDAGETSGRRKKPAVDR